jgi:hypothetical protein
VERSDLRRTTGINPISLLFLPLRDRSSHSRVLDRASRRSGGGGRTAALGRVRLGFCGGGGGVAVLEGCRYDWVPEVQLRVPSRSGQGRRFGDSCALQASHGNKVCLVFRLSNSVSLMKDLLRLVSMKIQDLIAVFLVFICGCYRFCQI